MTSDLIILEHSCSRILFQFIWFYYNSLSDSNIKQLVDLIKRKYVFYWNQTLEHERKLNFCTLSKITIALLLTLIQHKKAHENSGKTQDRLPHLCVETGSYDKIPFDERICPLCSGNKIVDETQLRFLDCQRYSSMRDLFLSKIETKIDDIPKLSHENLISQLMNSNDYYVNLRLIMFISSCFDIRDKLI